MRSKYQLVYLHGSADDYIILKTSDYDKFYPSIAGTTGSTVLQDYLKQLYLNCTLVFIGFSFNDRYMREALKQIHTCLTNEDALHAPLFKQYIPRLDSVQHYAFLKEFDLEKAKERLQHKELPGTDRYREELAQIELQSRKEAELDTLLKALRIQVIRYTEHIDWIRCFQQIRDLRKERSRINLAPVEGNP